jgi:hypothetical protein
LAGFRLSDEERQLSQGLGPGGVLIEPQESPSGAYRARGALGGWCRARFADRRYLLLVAEFGTYSPLKVLSALRRENQTHHFCVAGDPRLILAKQRLGEVFCPRSKLWRRECIEQAIQLIQSGIKNVGSRD